MPPRLKVQEEVGDLFVTGSSLTLKLMPSKKTASRPIGWFAEGAVTNVKSAAKDIAFLVGKLQGRTRVVKRLTVMTELGMSADLDKTGLPKAVAKAGYSILR